MSHVARGKAEPQSCWPAHPEGGRDGSALLAPAHGTARFGPFMVLGGSLTHRLSLDVGRTSYETPRGSLAPLGGTSGPISANFSARSYCACLGHNAAQNASKSQPPGPGGPVERASNTKRCTIARRRVSLHGRCPHNSPSPRDFCSCVSHPEPKFLQVPVAQNGPKYQKSHFPWPGIVLGQHFFLIKGLARQ